MLLSAEARGECALRRRRRKEAGNLGVEHAPPQAVVTALGAARRPQPLRAFFLREHLQPLGLVSEMGSFHRATVRYLPPGLPAALGMLRILRFHSARDMPMRFASVHLRICLRGSKCHTSGAELCQSYVASKKPLEQPNTEACAV